MEMMSVAPPVLGHLDMPNAAVSSQIHSSNSHPTEPDNVEHLSADAS